MGRLTAKTRDTQFEAEVLRTDPAIKRFKAMKALLTKHGYGSRLHDKECICLDCIEGAVRRIVQTK